MDCDDNINPSKRNMLRSTVALVVLLFALLAGDGVHGREDPVTVLETATKEVIDALERDPTIKQDPARIKMLVKEFVLPHVDFPTLSHWVLGKYWRRATDAQRQSFMKEFQDLLINTYGISLAEYSDQKLVFLPLRGDPASNSATVSARFEQEGAAPVSLMYRMHYRDDSWLVYDVVIEGVSFATTYRTTFGSEAREVGVQGLIDRLVQKNRGSREHPPEPLKRRNPAP